MSLPFAGLLAGLVIVLVATVLYVTEQNTVSSRQAQLVQVTAATRQWQAAAGNFQRDVQAAKQRSQQLDEVRHLAAARFDWSRLLGQVADLLPADAALSSMQAATPQTAGATAATGTAASTGTSGIQISACAASQSAVAQAMVQLRKITGVSNVSLSSSTTGSGSGTSSSSSSGSASGSCPFSTNFQVSLTFASSGSTGAATATPPSTGAAASSTGTSGAVS